MCLTITKDSKRLTRNLRRRRKPIVAYKILRLDMKSGFKGFWWKVGLNISNRESAKPTKEELETSEIDEGFHLALDKPEKCPHQCRYLYLCQCRHRYRYQYQCRYRCQCHHQRTKIFKCKIDPKDIVSAGVWEGIPSIVATKATLLEK